MHLLLNWFPEKYRENEAATAIANRLKWAPDRKGEGGRKKGLEADFSPVEIENGNGLIGLEEEEDRSSDSFDEMQELSYANDNLINDLLHLKNPEKFSFQMFLKNS